ncbi:MAG TPA: flagellar biosynthetic protein FliR [Nevskiaceae bacterium]|nr:flagellar biosynthetic protein FliR [Nevskiaceae bacterium]
MKLDLADLMPWMVSGLLVLFRVAALVMTAPILGAAAGAARTRLLLAIALTLVLVPVTPRMNATDFSASLILDCAEQVVIGVAMGLVIQIAFETLMLAGEMLSSGSGLSFAQLIDPVRGTDASALGGLLTALAMLLFLALDGHLALIKVLATSFKDLPLGAPIQLEGLSHNVVAAGTDLFMGAMQVALPGLIALLTVNLLMGVASRAAPTLNIFAVGLPVSVLAGLVVLYAGLQTFGATATAIFNRALDVLPTLFG